MAPPFVWTHLELVRFMRIHPPGTGFSVFDFSRLVHELADNLSHADRH